MSMDNYRGDVRATSLQAQPEGAVAIRCHKGLHKVRLYFLSMTSQRRLDSVHIVESFSAADSILHNPIKKHAYILSSECMRVESLIISH